jgi:hypothetical protein
MEYRINYRQLITIKRITKMFDELDADWRRELAEKPLSDIGIGDYERKKFAKAASALVCDFLKLTDFETFPPDSEKIRILLDTIKCEIHPKFRCLR